jgi:peroxin-11B
VETPLDNFTKNFNFLTRFFNALFYIFENLSILTTLKFINPHYRPHFEISMSLSWLMAQVFHISYYIGILKKTYTDEDDLRNMEVNKCKVKDIYEKLKLLSKIRIFLVLGIIRNFGDLLLSCYELKLFENFLGTKTMKLVVGITGLLSAVISIYQMFYSSPYLK